MPPGGINYLPTYLPTITCGVLIDPYNKPGPSQPSRSTIWCHVCGKPTQSDKAAGQQYLTPSEEKAVVKYALCMYKHGFPISVKFLSTIAHIIKRQRSSIFQTLAADDGIRPLGKNWPQGFYKRHLELQARKSDRWIGHAMTSMIKLWDGSLSSVRS